MIFQLFKRKKKTATADAAPAKSAVQESAASKPAASKPATSKPAAAKPAAAKTPSATAAKKSETAPAAPVGQSTGSKVPSVAELREQAKSLGITGVSRLTKAELQKAINARK